MTKRHLQIVVPLLIVALVVGLWFVKNHQATADPVFTAADKAALPEHLQTADFSLTADGSIDYAALSAYGLPLLIDYSSERCAPCQRMAPELQAVNSDVYGKAFVKVVNLDAYPEAAKDVPVLVYPTQIFVNADGTPFEPSAELQEKYHFAMYTDKESGALAYTTHQGALTAAQMQEILTEMGVDAAWTP